MPNLGIVLAPIVAFMRWLYTSYLELTASAGFSVLLLSFTLSVLLLPLQRLAMRVERKVAIRSRKVARGVSAARARGLRGEELFNATEAVYKRHGYHPAQVALSAASILVMLPVLLASILLFREPTLTAGQSFGFITDLSRPDGSLQLSGLTLNIVPLIMFGITFLDMSWRYAGDRQAQVRFLGISIVLLILVYGMPSCLVLYWTGNNLFALMLVLMLRRPPARASDA